MNPYTRPEALPILGANIEPFKFYVATGSDQCPDGEFPFWVNLCEGHRVVWGFSVWRGQRGYRTLGARLNDWLARPGNAAIVIREDRDRRLDERTRKPKPVDPRDAEIAALRAQVETAREEGRQSCHDDRDHADADLREHYAATLGLTWDSDTTPCWEDVIDAAHAQGRRDERADVVAWLRAQAAADSEQRERSRYAEDDASFRWCAHAEEEAAKEIEQGAHVPAAADAGRADRGEG